MADLSDYARLVARDHGLATVSTLRADQTIQASVVNTGVLDHRGHQVVGFTTRGDSRKLVNLRVRPRLAVTIRVGWEWVTVEGTAELLGPGDPAKGFDAEAVRLLLRAVFIAAGGTHDDWATYDRVMAEERRDAVMIQPVRVYSGG
ncbi:MAG TPA: pyridoxamine 5'-phosphate oxidase family protein [Streptosporangiaceae bacterium]|jgi:PPOX class probable F420-dependent enzyme